MILQMPRFQLQLYERPAHAPLHIEWDLTATTTVMQLPTGWLARSREIFALAMG